MICRPISLIVTPLLMAFSGLLYAGEAENYYVTNVESLVQAKCIACHRADGVGSENLIFSSSAVGNHQAFDRYVNTPVKGANAGRVLSKITGELGHGGGAQVVQGSAEYKAFADYMTLLSAVESELYTVTPSASVGGFISPSDPVFVNANDTTSFTVTASQGYELHSVGGTCDGSMSGITYTTISVVRDCTVAAIFRELVVGGIDQDVEVIPVLPPHFLLIMIVLILALGAFNLRVCAASGCQQGS